MKRMQAIVATLVVTAMALGGNRRARVAFALAIAVVLISSHHGHAAAGFKIGGG